MEVDGYDLKILGLLQDNGRLTNQELSELVGLSPSQCSRRRINLENSQLILGYHARLAPRALQQEVIAMIEIKLLNHGQNNTATFLAFIDQDKAVVEAFKTTGEADYLLKCTVSNLDTLNDLVNRIFTTQAISHIKTTVVLERLKEHGTTITKF